MASLFALTRHPCRKTAGAPLRYAEIKRYRQGNAQAKADTMRSLCVPAVNNHGQLGRWAFLEITDIHEATRQIRAFLDGSRPAVAA
jgi:hypothetical protein